MSVRFANRRELAAMLAEASEAANDLWPYPDVDPMPYEAWLEVTTAYLAARGDRRKAAERMWLRMRRSVLEWQ